LEHKLSGKFTGLSTEGRRTETERGGKKRFGRTGGKENLLQSEAPLDCPDGWFHRVPSQSRQLLNVEAQPIRT